MIYFHSTSVLQNTLLLEYSTCHYTVFIQTLNVLNVVLSCWIVAILFFFLSLALFALNILSCLH